MTSPEIIKAVATSTGATQKLTKEIVDALEVAIKTKVSEGEKFKAVDVTFSTADVAEREGRNPKTGEAITIPARTKVNAKLSADFKKIGK